MGTRERQAHVRLGNQATSLKAEKISLVVAREQSTRISEGGIYSQVQGEISSGSGQDCPNVHGINESVREKRVNIRNPIVFEVTRSMWEKMGHDWNRLLEIPRRFHGSLFSHVKSHVWHFPQYEITKAEIYSCFQRESLPIESWSIKVTINEMMR